MLWKTGLDSKGQSTAKQAHRRRRPRWSAALGAGNLLLLLSELCWQIGPMEQTDAELVAAARQGDAASFEPLVRKYQGRIFATARRYARRESEVEDIVQEVFIKAFQKLDGFRGEAPFEHWLMRLAVRTCYDFLRGHQRNRETAFTELTGPESDWLDRFVVEPDHASEDADAARELMDKVLSRLSPPARLVITLLEIEEKSVKEIARLTGWSVPLVKVRAFRARAEMKKILTRMSKDKYL
jgi:RNA polymerase sigma-70 factor (ECF subfamily)